MCNTTLMSLDISSYLLKYNYDIKYQCLIYSFNSGSFGAKKAGLSEVATCWKKSPPMYLVSISYSAWHFFADGILNEISLDWPLTLTTQPSTSKLSDNPEKACLKKGSCSFFFSSGQNQNPVPWSFFAPKLHRNACYAS